METSEGDTFGKFKKNTSALNTHATIKTKLIRFNKNVLMTKELRKEIMKRSKLRKKLIETENMKVGVISNFRGTTV